MMIAFHSPRYFDDALVVGRYKQLNGVRFNGRRASAHCAGMAGIAAMPERIRWDYCAGIGGTLTEEDAGQRHCGARQEQRTHALL